MSQQPAATNHGRVARPQENANQPPPPQSCPRCNSANTKFCYYNNYSLSQPRYFCKGCRRYWTHGGTLRNIPVGGGCRKGKRPKLSPSTSDASPSFPSQSHVAVAGAHHHQALRATNPLMMNGGMPYNNLYNDSSAAGSSLGIMVQPQPPQGGVAGGYGGQFGGNLPLLQGMNYQSLKPQESHQQQMIQQRAPPLASWTQGFISNNAGAAAHSSSMAPNTSFWGEENVGGDHGNANNQAGGHSFNPNNNQWKNHRNNNQGFDHSR